MVIIWSVTTELPNEPQIQQQLSDVARVEHSQIQYLTSPKGVFDYINEILTTVIGVINIVTFGYQMRDKKLKKTI
tara:strand:+ start:334 stop:558 length:225 start_codon:yes stop_codon:yes gene_type:complete